jgi:hypothetical protein
VAGFRIDRGAYSGANATTTRTHSGEQSLLCVLVIGSTNLKWSNEKVAGLTTEFLELEHRLSQMIADSEISGNLCKSVF